MQRRPVNILTSTDNVNAVREKKNTLKGQTVKIENGIEVFELAKSCNLDKTFTGRILQTSDLWYANFKEYICQHNPTK